MISLYAIIGACWSKAQIADKLLIETWCRILGDLPSDALEKAVLDFCMGPENDPPTPGQIRERARRIAVERFEREVFPSLARELIESSVSEEYPGLLDANKAEDAIKANPLVKKFGVADGRARLIVNRFQIEHPERFPSRGAMRASLAFTQFKQFVASFTAAKELA